MNRWHFRRLDAADEYPSRAGGRRLGGGPHWGRVVSGTSLVAVLATAAVGASTYWGSGAVEPSAAALIAAPAVVAAPCGAYLATHLNARVPPRPVMPTRLRTAMSQPIAPETAAECPGLCPLELYPRWKQCIAAVRRLGAIAAGTATHSGCLPAHRCAGGACQGDVSPCTALRSSPILLSMHHNAIAAHRSFMLDRMSFSHGACLLLHEAEFCPLLDLQNTAAVSHVEV